MKPSIGRIVIYEMSSWDKSQVNNRRSNVEQGAKSHVGNAAGDRYPMIVVAIADDEWMHGQVNGQVFLDGSDVLWVHGIEEGDGEGMWHWPG